MPPVRAREASADPQDPDPIEQGPKITRGGVSAGPGPGLAPPGGPVHPIPAGVARAPGG